MGKTDIIGWINENEFKYTELAERIWNWPEIGYTESFASDLQMQSLIGIYYFKKFTRKTYQKMMFN